MINQVPLKVSQFILACWYGKTWHAIKIEESIAKKFDYAMSQADIEAFIVEIESKLI